MHASLNRTEIAQPCGNNTKEHRLVKTTEKEHRLA
jgi:hypothetical protein